MRKKVGVSTRSVFLVGDRDHKSQIDCAVDGLLASWSQTGFSLCCASHCTALDLCACEPWTRVATKTTHIPFRFPPGEPVSAPLQVQAQLQLEVLGAAAATTIADIGAERRGCQAARQTDGRGNVMSSCVCVHPPSAVRLSPPTDKGI